MSVVLTRLEHTFKGLVWIRCEYFFLQNYSSHGSKTSKPLLLHHICYSLFLLLVKKDKKIQKNVPENLPTISDNQTWDLRPYRQLKRFLCSYVACFSNVYAYDIIPNIRVEIDIQQMFFLYYFMAFSNFSYIINGYTIHFPNNF